MNFTKNFKELNKGDAGIAGGKGASLGEMTKAGIPVPGGFVVLSTTFDRFLEETDLTAEVASILETVDHKEIHTVENASEKIQGLIKNVIMPADIATEIKKEFEALDLKYVAVRSSATAEDGQDHAWAGQLDSFLNTTEADLLQKVQFCWASLFTPRAIFYRFEKGLYTTQISVAVVVQKMINSEISGIAFSVHPVTEDFNQLIIEAGFGLGEAIVSGSVTPDSYVVEKVPRKIIDINVYTQSRALYRVDSGGNEWKEVKEPQASSQVLNEAQISELSEIILGIEKHYGFPCDIEWAFEGGKFYIVQSRPITTLSVKITQNNTGGINPTDYHFFGLWKCTLFPDWYWTKWLVPEYAEKIGLELSDGGIFVINGGNFFTKKSVIETIRQYAKSIIESNDKNKLVTLKKLADDIYADSLKRAEQLSLEKPTENNVREMAELGQHIMFPWCFGYILSEVFDEFLIPAAENAGIKLEDISSLLPPFRTPLMDAQDNLRSIKKVLEEKGFWKILLEDSGKAVEQIQKDAEVSKLIKEHSSKYGWTTVINLAGEDPSLEQIIDQITHIPALNHQKHTPKTIKELSFLIECAESTAYLRQTGVEYFSIYSRFAIKLFQAASKKLGITYRELLDLNLGEIIAGINGGDVKEIIKRRTGDKWAIYSMPDNQEPFVIDDLKVLEYLASVMIPKAQTSDDGSIRGQIGNKGIGKGKVKVILSLEDFHKMETGDVLVTTMTTPDFVPLMQKSVAVITDIGGLLCHAAIISRELNTPCVIGTKFATQLLKDGDMVEVDADSGLVRIMN